MKLPSNVDSERVLGLGWLTGWPQGQPGPFGLPLSASSLFQEGGWVWELLLPSPTSLLGFDLRKGQPLPLF